MSAYVGSMEGPKFSPSPEWEKVSRAVSEKITSVNEKAQSTIASTEERITAVRQRIQEIAQEKAEAAQKVAVYAYEHRKEIAKSVWKASKREGKYVALGFAAKTTFLAVGGWLGYAGAPITAAGVMLYSGVRSAFSEKSKLDRIGSREYFKHHAGYKAFKSEENKGGIWEGVKNAYAVATNGLAIKAVEVSYHSAEHQKRVSEIHDWLETVRNRNVVKYSQEDLMDRMKTAKLAIDTATTKNEKTAARNAMKELYRMALAQNEWGGRSFEESKGEFKGLSKDVNAQMKDYSNTAWKMVAGAKGANSGLRFMSGAFIADIWHGGADSLRSFKDMWQQQTNPTSHDAFVIARTRTVDKVYLPAMSGDTTTVVHGGPMPKLFSPVDSEKLTVVPHVTVAHEVAYQNIAATKDLNIVHGDDMYHVLKHNGLQLDQAGSAKTMLNMIDGQVNLSVDEKAQLQEIILEYKDKGVELNAYQLGAIYDKVRRGERDFNSMMYLQVGKMKLNVVDTNGDRVFHKMIDPMTTGARRGKFDDFGEVKPVVLDQPKPPKPSVTEVPAYTFTHDGNIASSDTNSQVVQKARIVVPVNVQAPAVVQPEAHVVSGGQSGNVYHFDLTPQNTANAVSVRTQRVNNPTNIQEAIITIPKNNVATADVQNSSVPLSKADDYIRDIKSENPIKAYQTVPVQTEMLPKPIEQLANTNGTTLKLEPTNLPDFNPNTSSDTQFVPMTEITTNEFKISLENMLGLKPIDGAPDVLNFNPSNVTEAVYDPTMSIVELPKKAYSYMIDFAKNNVWVYTHSSGLIEHLAGGGTNRIPGPGEYGRVKFEELFGEKSPLSEVQVQQLLNDWATSNTRYVLPSDQGDLILQPLHAQLLKHNFLEHDLNGDGVTDSYASQQDFFNLVPESNTITFVFCGRAQTEALNVFAELKAKNITDFPSTDFTAFANPNVDQDTYVRSFGVLKQWLIDHQTEYPTQFKFFKDRFYLLDENNQLVEKNLSWTRYALTFKVANVGGGQ